MRRSATAAARAAAATAAMSRSVTATAPRTTAARTASCAWTTASKRRRAGACLVAGAHQVECECVECNGSILIAFLFPTIVLVAFIAIGICACRAGRLQKLADLAFDSKRLRTSRRRRHPQRGSKSSRSKWRWSRSATPSRASQSKPRSAAARPSGSPLFRSSSGS